jgi:6,7-dimethyl-8-ribityllumazine synthase
MDGLIAGALRVLEQAGAKAPLIRVPGSFELPVTVSSVLLRADAAVALGVVIRGETPHFDYVCQAASVGLTHVALQAGKPVGFGVLTCDTEEQALARAGLPGSIEDKGAEAASAALATLAAFHTTWWKP